MGGALERFEDGMWWGLTLAVPAFWIQSKVKRESRQPRMARVTKKNTSASPASWVSSVRKPPPGGGGGVLTGG